MSWIDAKGTIYPANNSKLIYYPQYPEVRFSGFLRGSKVNASKWMDPNKQGRCEGRWLVFGVTKNKEVYAYLATPKSRLSKELADANYIEVSQTVWQLDSQHTTQNEPTRDTLIRKLLGIHQMGWIPGQKLSPSVVFEPYNASNAGGYTLEAILGIPPNSIAGPDYMGWEVKQFGVKRFPAIGTKPTTLMTPGPNGGYYDTAGAVAFVKAYGYADKSGKKDRINFGGRHLAWQLQKLTNLTMTLIGFDTESSSITDASGALVLLDNNGEVAASWSFAKLMNHWKRKHSQAVYIPSIRRIESGIHQHHYGKDIQLGTGTTFEMILSAINMGIVYYDPGTKVEHASTDAPKIKPRNQFRVNHKYLCTLYKSYDLIDITI